MTGDVRELAAAAVTKSHADAWYKGHALRDEDLADAVLAAITPVIEERAAKKERERLVAAELVCDLYGITGVRSDSPRDKAATQAWMDWSHRYGAGRPLPTGELIAELAAKRDTIHAATLTKIQQRHPDIAAIARSHSTPKDADHE